MVEIVWRPVVVLVVICLVVSISGQSSGGGRSEKLNEKGKGKGAGIPRQELKGKGKGVGIPRQELKPSREIQTGIRLIDALSQARRVILAMELETRYDEMMHTVPFASMMVRLSVEEKALLSSVYSAVGGSRAMMRTLSRPVAGVHFFVETSPDTPPRFESNPEMLATLQNAVQKDVLHRCHTALALVDKLLVPRSPSSGEGKTGAASHDAAARVLQLKMRADMWLYIAEMSGGDQRKSAGKAAYKAFSAAMRMALRALPANSALRLSLSLNLSLFLVNFAQAPQRGISLAESALADARAAGRQDGGVTPESVVLMHLLHESITLWTWGAR